MSKNVPAPPPQTNPTAVANQSNASNVGTGIANATLANPNTSNALYSTNYAQSGNTVQVPDGNGGFISVPQMSATTTLSPQTQALLNQSVAGLTSGEGNSSNITTSIDPALINQSMNAFLTTVNPEIAAQQKALNTQLINEGFSPDPQSGTNAYNEAQLLNDQQVNQLLAQGYGTAFNSALQAGQFTNAAQQQAYNENAGLLGGVAGFATGTPYNAPTIAPTNVADIYASNAQTAEQGYAAQQQANATQLAGLYGGLGNLAGAGLYGLGSGKIPTPSDRRIKTDIERIGTWHNGLPVYLFRYIFDPLRKLYVGFMAQDVELFRPAAVVTLNGVKAVRYDLAVK